MITERMSITGVIRGGVVVPDTRLSLPEGTEVEISFSLTALPQDLTDEFEAWNRASEDAWALSWARRKAAAQAKESETEDGTLLEGDNNQTSE